MEMYISEELSRILEYAKEEAMRTGAYKMSSGHLFLGLIRDRENSACLALSELGADLEKFKRFLEARLFTQGRIPYEDEDKITLGRSAENAFNMTILEAKLEGVGKIECKHLLLALLRCQEEECKGCFEMAGIKRESIEEKLHSNTDKNSLEQNLQEVGKFQFNFLEIIDKDTKILN